MFQYQYREESSDIRICADYRSRRDEWLILEDWCDRSS